MLEMRTTHVRAERYLGTHRPQWLMAGGLVGEALHNSGRRQTTPASLNAPFTPLGVV